MEDELHFFQEWWNILRKYWNPPNKYDQSKEACKFWDGLVRECLALKDKYKGNGLFFPFAEKMVSELITEVGRRSVELHR